MSVPDYTLEDTLDFKFTTRQFSTGAPFAFASGAIEIYEDNDIAQIIAAETLTLEFDGVTGLHNLRVAATAANGFENGKSYHCVVSAGTVDSVSVIGEVVQQFSIGRSAAAVRLPAALVGSRMDSNVSAINNIAGSAPLLEASISTNLSGVASGTPTTTTMVSDIGVTVDNQFNGRTIIFDNDTATAALQGQATDITGCTAASNTLTFTALTTAPASGETFQIV
jgi:hypothetical protein